MIVSVIQERRSLPGHVDTYDAIGLTEDFEEIGLYQHLREPTWFFNGPTGTFVDIATL